MSAPKLTRIKSDCSVELVTDDGYLTPDERETVERIWLNELAANPKLFNGKQLSVVKIEPRVITCRAVEYKQVLAQLRHPGTIREFQLRPLALTVILEVEESLVFGKRSQTVSQMPGYWEPAPSGGVELGGSVDGSVVIQEQALRELREELGLEPCHIRCLVPVAVFEDQTDHVVDICVHGRANIAAHKLLALFNELPGWEYETIRIVPLSELQQFLDQNHQRLVAPTLPFLHECKVI